MSTQVVFANMDKSSILENHVRQEIEKVIEGHTGSKGFDTRIKLEMENSPFHRGLDAFRIFVKMRVRGLKPIILKKSGADMYQAIRASMESLRLALTKAHDVRKHRQHHRHLKASQKRLQAELFDLNPTT